MIALNVSWNRSIAPGHVTATMRRRARQGDVRGIGNRAGAAQGERAVGDDRAAGVGIVGPKRERAGVVLEERAGAADDGMDINGPSARRVKGEVVSIQADGAQKGQRRERDGREGLIGIKGQGVADRTRPKGPAVVGGADARVEGQRIAFEGIGLAHHAATAVEEADRVEGCAIRVVIAIVGMRGGVRELQVIAGHRRDIAGPIVRVGPGNVRGRTAAPTPEGGAGG